MADHWQKQIRDALKTKLTVPPLLSLVAANVFIEDEYPRESGKFPGVNIAFADTQRRRIGTVNLGAGVQGIEVENLAAIEVEIVVRQDTGCRDLLIQIAKEIEVRWLATPADKYLGVQGCRDSELINIRQPNFDVDSDVLTATQVVQFEVTVRSFEGRPDQS